MRRISRRAFLANAAGTAASFTIVPRHVLGGPGFTPPSEVITRAVIGTGGMGMAAHVMENVEGKPPVTLAVCDVDRKHRERALAKVGRACEAYADFRDVLDRTDIDTVHIVTPPHWHAVMAIMAAQAGKDILGEKPATRTIGEGQAVIEAIERYGRVYQVNTHGRAHNYYRYGSSRRLRKLIASGRLGSPLTVRLGPQQGITWKVKMWSGRTDLVAQPVPDELDYDMWLGPAPYKPYHPHRVHQSFRGYWDYDGGGLADMGQHYLDPVQYMLGKDNESPVEIEAEAPWPTHPDAVSIWYQITMRYADGTTLLLDSGMHKGDRSADGAFIEGPHGKLYANYRTEPEGLFDGVDDLPDPPEQIDFETAVRTRRQPYGHIRNAHRSCSLVNLANIAIRAGRMIRFDPQREQCIGDEQANRLISQPLRSPWHL